MRRIHLQIQLITAVSLRLILRMSAGLLLGAVAVPAYSEDRDMSSGRGGLIQPDSERGTRVFSKDKPLFRQNQRIPNVTPDRSGNTKVKVIVRPMPPDRQMTVGDGAKETRSQRSARPKPPLDAYRGVRGRPQHVDIPTANSRENSSRPAQIAPKAEGSGQTVSHASVLLPTANPKRLSVARSAQQEYSRTRQARKIKADARLRQARLTQMQQKRRKRYAQRARKKSRRGRPYHGRPYWRRFAPPGTVHSFVRCWPGEPCVRYYRVRRPRTLRQHRRLLAWQRRQDARLRYRRLYGRY